MLCRFHTGLTVKKAAARCGLNYGSWSKWENGASPRDLLTVVARISEGLGVDREWLLFGGPLAEPDDERASWMSRRPAVRAEASSIYTRLRPVALRPAACVGSRSPGRVALPAAA